MLKRKVDTEQYNEEWFQDYRFLLDNIKSTGYIKGKRWGKDSETYLRNVSTLMMNQLNSMLFSLLEVLEFPRDHENDELFVLFFRCIESIISIDEILDTKEETTLELCKLLIAKSYVSLYNSTLIPLNNVCDCIFQLEDLEDKKVLMYSLSIN